MRLQEPKSDEVFRLLQQADWDRMLPRLVSFAEHQLDRYGWARESKDMLPKGMTGEDVAQTVIVKAYYRIRKWDPARGELLPWLFSCVRSEVDNLAKSAAHKYEVLAPSSASGEGTDNQPDWEETHLGERGGLELPERQILQNERVDALYSAASSSPELEELLDAIMDEGEKKPATLAAALGIQVVVVYNRLRTLRRRARKLRDQHE